MDGFLDILQAESDWKSSLHITTGRLRPFTEWLVTTPPAEELASLMRGAVEQHDYHLAVLAGWVLLSPAYAQKLTKSVRIAMYQCASPKIKEELVERVLKTADDEEIEAIRRFCAYPPARIMDALVREEERRAQNRGE